MATATLLTPRKRSSALSNAGPDVDTPAARAGQQPLHPPGPSCTKPIDDIATDTTMSAPQPPTPGPTATPRSTTEPGERQRHVRPIASGPTPATECRIDRSGGPKWRNPDPIRPTLPGHRDRAYLGVMTAQSYPRHEGVPGCAGTGKPADRPCRIRSALPGRRADRPCSARTALPGKPAERPCSARSPLRWAILRWAIQGRG